MQLLPVLARITEKMMWCARYIVLHPVKALIFVIKVYLTLILFAFCMTATFAAFANITIEKGMDIDGHLYHISNALGQRTETTVVAVTNDMHDGGDPGNAISAYCSAYEQSDRNPIISGCSIQSSSVANSVLTGQCSCGYTDGRFDPPSWTVIHEVSVQVAPLVVYSCPPQNKPFYTLAITQSEITMCYDPLDLSTRDTCPTGPTSPDFMLPSDGSGNERICSQTNDGSICAYDLAPDAGVYTPNFEANCYEGNIPMYDESQLSDTADNDPDRNCEDLGNGTMACIEDPENVCTGFSCQEGCGIFGLGDQTEFICISGDLDGDDVPDYADPDIDGDGIPNEQDLDSDGDGQDDPDYGEPTEQVAVTVTFDDSGIISAINAQGNKLDGKLGEINDQLTPTKNVDFAIPGTLRDMTEPNDYSQRNYGTVIDGAVSRMKTAPLFTAIDGFFNVSFVGQCPIYSTYVDYIKLTITIDHFCGPVMTAIWPIIQAVVMVVFSLMAFRVAIL